MTEYRPYQPDLAPQSAQERFVFVDPTDRHQREFEVYAAANSGVAVRGVDNPDLSGANAAIEDAFRQSEERREEAAARTAEQGASDPELARAIDWNAQAIEATREHVVTNGF